MTEDGYVHGYSSEEQERLVTQSRFLEPWIYRQVDFGGASRIIEVGCGVGAQLRILRRRFPEAQLCGVDRSPTQIATARSLLGDELAAGRLELIHAPGEALPLPSGSFDGAFLCWVLEHASNPEALLAEVRRVLEPGGVLYVTEVFNASLFTIPRFPALDAYWQALSAYQAELGGDPHIGLRLANLLKATGFVSVDLSPVTIQLDDREVDPTTRRCFFAYWRELFLSARSGLLAAGRVSEDGVAAMEADFASLAASPHAVFYTAAMQARAVKM